jgi:aryl-alcohol dehydrogenase-like predicted oxidoreductase
MTSQSIDELAIAVLRTAVARGVDHIDTSDFCGPHVTNQLIAEVGARRGADASWLPAMKPKELEEAVHDNLRNLRVDALDVVNLRVMKNEYAPVEGSIEEPFTALAELQRRGLIRHLGVSNATSSQVREARQLANVVCVQNHYNLVTGWTTHWWMSWQPSASLTRRFFRWAGSRPCSPRTFHAWQPNWEPRRCKSRWPGFCIVRRTFV